MNTTVFAAALSMTVNSWEMDKMAFVYHKVRHGARAPAKAFNNVEPTAEDLKSWLTLSLHRHVRSS